jgi:chromosome partitioning protein
MKNNNHECHGSSEFFGRLTPQELADVLELTPQSIYKQSKTQNITLSASATGRRTIPPHSARQILTERGFAFPQQVVSFQIVKGGSGKTTLAFGVATRAQEYGARVLVIDLDKQGNLTYALGVKDSSLITLADIVAPQSSYSIEDAIINIDEYLDLVPSSLENTRLDIELNNNHSLNPEKALFNILKNVRSNYDLIILDCPPDLDAVTSMATLSSDVIIIPVMPDAFNADGLTYTVRELERFKDNYDKAKSIEHYIVLNNFDARLNLSLAYLRDLAMKYPGNFLVDNPIRSDATVKRAIQENKPFSAFPKRTTIREDIDRLTRKILRINQFIANRQAA